MRTFIIFLILASLLAVAAAKNDKKTLPVQQSDGVAGEAAPKHLHEEIMRNRRHRKTFGRPAPARTPAQRQKAEAKKPSNRARVNIIF